MPTDTSAAPAANLPATRERAVVEHVQPLFDTARFEHYQRAANALMNSTLLSPAVRGDSPAQCFSNLILVFEQADRWNIPATALAQCVSIVHGKLMYEGKVVTAMLEGVLGTRLHYHWTGTRGSEAYRIYVSDRPFSDMSAEELAALAPDRYPAGFRIIDGSVGEWRTFQKDGRTPNPAWTGAATRNQLAYRGAREWARLYESGAMLGVYGDDEISAWEQVHEVGGADTAGQITAGFTRPAESPVDAEFEVIGAGDPAPPPPKEEPVPAKPNPKAPKKSAAEKDAERAEATAEATAQRLAKCEAAQAAGHRAALAGEPDTPPDGLTGEEQAYWHNGHLTGSQDQQQKDTAAPATIAQAVDTGDRSGLASDAYEAGHALGLTGEDLAVPREWSEFADDFTQGFHAGGAERLEDASDLDDDGEDDADTFPGDADDAENDAADLEEAEEPAEPLAAFDAFDAYNAGVRGLDTWAEVKQSMVALTKTQAWKDAMAAKDPRVRQARICAWLRVTELQAAGKEAVDVLGDLTAFRCWAEATDDADMIQAKWQELVRQPVYESLNDDQKRSLENSIAAIMRERRAP